MKITSRKLDDIDPYRDFTHLPKTEGVSINATECMFLLLLDRFLQVTHRLAFSDVDMERVIRHIENPTEKCESLPILHNKFDFIRRLMLVETLKFLLVGDANYVPVIEETEIDVLR